MSTSQQRQSNKRRHVIQVLIVGLLIYVILAGFSGLHSSVQAISSANIGLIFLATVTVVISYICAAVTYWFLASTRLAFLPTLLVEISGGLVNRLLPGGLGGMGIHVLFLKKHHHSAATSAMIVTLNSILGFLGNLLLLGVISRYISLHHASSLIPRLPQISWMVVAGLIIIAILIGIITRWHNRTSNLFIRSWGHIITYMQYMKDRPFRLMAALTSSVVLTALHATALYIVILSIGLHTSWAVALFAISLGAIAGVIIPTPGGVGGAEAGIAAALIVIGMPAHDAVAGALLFRGLTYWLPLIPGYFAYRIVEKRYIY